MKVQFYDEIDDQLIKFVVIVSRSNDQWVFVKHHLRETYEIPGGHREKGETTLQAAIRELKEETGAICFDIKPVCVYSVIGKTRVNESGEETFGMLYYADISSFDQELHSEIEKVILCDDLPDHWTYPLIQPHFIEEMKKRKIIC